jgi:hypothetical protein
MPVAQPPLLSPQLWSIQVVEEPYPGRPINICADQHIREGFVLRVPEIQGRLCRTDSLKLNYRCTLAGRMFGVSTALSGDLTQAFVVHSSVTD